MSRLSVILDYLAENGWDGRYESTPDTVGQIIVTPYPSNPDKRTGVIPVDYCEAKLFVERKPPYDHT